MGPCPPGPTPGGVLVPLPPRATGPAARRRRNPLSLRLAVLWRRRAGSSRPTWLPPSGGPHASPLAPPLGELSAEGGGSPPPPLPPHYARHLNRILRAAPTGRLDAIRACGHSPRGGGFALGRRAGSSRPTEGRRGQRPLRKPSGPPVGPSKGRLIPLQMPPFGIRAATDVPSTQHKKPPRSGTVSYIFWK